MAHIIGADLHDARRSQTPPMTAMLSKAAPVCIERNPTPRVKLRYAFHAEGSAGKTTFARGFLVREVSRPAFVNADLIAAGLSLFDPVRAALRAGSLMLELIAEHVARGESFAFETTLAGRNFARAIERWRSVGYHVSLIFLSVRETIRA